MANSQPQTPAKKQKPTRKADPVRKSSLRSSSRSSPALPSSKPMHHSPSPTVASLPDQTRSPQAEDGEQASDLPSGSILDERSSVAAPDTDRDLDIPTRAPMWSWADSGEKASVGGEDESTLSNTGITRDPSNSPDFQYFAREANEDQISSGDEDEGATSPTVIQTDLSGTRETQRAEHKAKEERDVSQSTSSATASGLEAVSTSTAEVTAKRKLDVIDLTGPFQLPTFVPQKRKKTAAIKQEEIKPELKQEDDLDPMSKAQATSRKSRFALALADKAAAVLSKDRQDYMDQIPMDVHSKILKSLSDIWDTPEGNKGTFSLEAVVHRKSRDPTESKFVLQHEMPILNVSPTFWRNVHDEAYLFVPFSAKLELKKRPGGILPLKKTLDRLPAELRTRMQHLTLFRTDIAMADESMLLQFVAIFAQDESLSRTVRLDMDHRQSRVALYNAMHASLDSTVSPADEKIWREQIIARPYLDVVYEDIEELEKDEQKKNKAKQRSNVDTLHGIVLLRGLQYLGERLGALGIKDKEDIEYHFQNARYSGDGVTRDVWNAMKAWAMA